MRALIKLATVTALTFVSSAYALAQDKMVHIGTLGWEDTTAITLITKKFLEKEGYKAEITDFSEWGIAFGALSHKDIDVMCSMVDYVTSDYWQKNHDKLEKVSVVSYGLYQTLAVPTYMSIDSIDQLNSIKDSVKGKIVGIEPGSGLMRDVKRAVAEYKLDYQVIEGSTAAMTAQLQSSIERKEPIVTMLWEPSWMMHKFPVKFLKDPKGVFPASQAYYLIAAKGFSAKNPELRADLATVYVPIDDIGEITVEMSNGKTEDKAVDAWWDKHAELIAKWSLK
jgi:glycine betaine/proline transport system substrate-binding protein